MGATGSNKAGGSNSVMSFQDGGTTIKFDSPLIYSDNKQSLTSAASPLVMSFENKHANSKREHSLLLKDDGTVVETNRGGKSSVKATLGARLNSDVLTHNHPNSEGGLGGTFSDADLDNFVKFSQHMYRASAKEGTYVISKGNGYTNAQGQQFVSDYKAMLKAQDKQYKKVFKQLTADYTQEVRDIYADNSLDHKQKSQKANDSYKKVLAKQTVEVNKLLINNHNWLLANAKKFGLDYGLERRT